MLLNIANMNHLPLGSPAVLLKASKKKAFMHELDTPLLNQWCRQIECGHSPIPPLLSAIKAVKGSSNPNPIPRPSGMSFFSGAHHFSINGDFVFRHIEGNYYRSGSSRQTRNNNRTSSSQSSSSHHWTGEGRTLGGNSGRPSQHNRQLYADANEQPSSQSNNPFQYTRTSYYNSDSHTRIVEYRNGSESPIDHFSERPSRYHFGRTSFNNVFVDHRNDEEDPEEDYYDREHHSAYSRPTHHSNQLIGGTVNSVDTAPHRGATMVTYQRRGNNPFRNRVHTTSSSSVPYHQDDELPHDPDYPRIPDPEVCLDPPPSYLDSFKDLPAPR
ncbi:hypothetical protein D9757_010661 [Collybiopsis confluens]|uniref:Uncharacterized protein n=1 Tax=Collybiopsis confluens TaxID=2823264 RepID=A0A8H5GMF5_9AGAR|nr:hypothetical protein D9757_010661 [Collybiopsis confluens]